MTALFNNLGETDSIKNAEFLQYVLACKYASGMDFDSAVQGVP